ncbi:MAG: hypothetical protein HY747_00040 [Elusimicrobia bacterium]|nr:hypothetical protein [Elusimicrobiota bacterium]
MTPTDRNNFSLPRVLGRSAPSRREGTLGVPEGRGGLTAGPLGPAASYGAPAKAYEMAFERGCNLFYWGSYRHRGMKEAIKNLAPRHRDKMLIALQSYWRFPFMLRRSVASGLKKLNLDLNNG